MPEIRWLNARGFPNCEPQGVSKTPQEPSFPSGPLEPEHLQRPDAVLCLLYDALLPYSIPCQVAPRRLTPGGDTFWLVTSGRVEVYRKYDDMTFWVTNGPALIGLVELFQPFGRHYVRLSAETRVATLPVDKVREILTSRMLWQEVSEVLAHYFRLLIYRDEHLVCKASYTAIRSKLLEFLMHKDSRARQRAGVVTYIQRTTLLSRTLIYHVLSDLEKGGYIRMDNGRLEAIRQLPKQY